MVLWKGELDSLRSVLCAVPTHEDLGVYGHAYDWRARLFLLSQQPDSLLELLKATPGPFATIDTENLPTALYAAWAHEMRADDRSARVAYGEALGVLDSLSKVRPRGWAFHASRGLALAGLGRKAEALREARWLQQSKIYQHDHVDGPILREFRAHVLAQASEPEAALEELEWLLSRPSYLSGHLLRLDPRWDPIREHPRFKALLLKYANPEKAAR